MNHTDYEQLLGIVALNEPTRFPNGVATDSDVRLWEMTLTDPVTGTVLVDSGELAIAAAIRHYQSSRYPIKAADIIDGAARIKRERISAWKVRNGSDHPELPADLTPRQEIEWRRTFWAAVRDGAPSPEARADHEHGITRQALPPADLSKVAAIESVAGSLDIRSARSAALRTINQEAQA